MRVACELIRLFLCNRPISQIRKDAQVPIPVSKDSVYKPIVRQAKVFKKFVVPKKLQEVSCFKRPYHASIVLYFLCCLMTIGSPIRI
jgi:hypothetical protein